MSKKVDQLRKEPVENILGDTHRSPPEHERILRGVDDYKFSHNIL